MQGPTDSSKLRSIEPPREVEKKGQNDRQIRVLADAEGGPIFVLSDGGAQWPY
jgi:hypothetical protein